MSDEHFPESAPEPLPEPAPVTLTPIGVIRTPFAARENMPIQPSGARGVEGRIVLRPDLAPALRDLDGFSHLLLLYHFHRSSGYDLIVTPFLDDTPRGLFATRAPRRPNPLGVSVVRLVGVEGNVLRIADIDVLDGTPLLDIKPHVPAFDAPEGARAGWLERTAVQAGAQRSDGRFVEEGGA